MRAAALAQLVLAELARTPRGTTSESNAEVAGLLRLVGRLQVGTGTPRVVAELRSGSAAERLRRALGDLYGYDGAISVLPGRGSARPDRYLLRVSADAWQLGRRTGLVGPGGRPVRGLPPAVVSGSLGDLAALWRGAFLASGTFAEPSKASPVLELACPRPEVALALVGAARRLAVPARTRETREGMRVVVRDEQAVAALLVRMGANTSVTRWREGHGPPGTITRPVRLANLAGANVRRSGDAAARTTARVARALQILAADVPEPLGSAARLRLQHPGDSLEQLGQRADPPLTKDAVAGRLRRLLTTADAVARAIGIPDTQAVRP